MRLLQIVPLYDSYCVFLRELTEAMIGDGHDVMTLCRTGPENTIPFDARDRSCRDFPLPRGSNAWQQLWAARRLRRILADYEPDIVHAHFSAAILTAAMATSPRYAGIRFMGTFQGLQYPFTLGLRGRLLRGGECWAASRMDEVRVLTDDDATALRRDAPRARVFKQDAPGFGCQDQFLDMPIPDSPERKRLRATQGFLDHHIVFIFIGRLVDFKGFHLAARAFMQAYPDRPQIRWLVIGEPDPLHPSSLNEKEWEAFRSHEGISWLKTQADVLPLLDVSDAMLFPTAREGMPVSVMESIARRVPVLTNKVRGCRELVEDGVNGRFFRESSVEAICESLKTFESFQSPEPSPRLRRSNWIAEMRAVYGTP